MKRNGYDKFFTEAKKNAQAAAPAQSVSMTALRENMQIKKSKKKTARKFPVLQFVLFIICGLGLFMAIENFDKIESTLQKLEFSLGVAQAAETSSVSSTTASPEKNSSASVLTSGTATASATARAENEDDTDYIYNLSARKKVLDQREEELNKKAAAIDAQKIAIEKKLIELEEYRAKISNMLQERIKSDDAKIETLVQVYTSMKPSQTAKIFETMDEDLVIDILSRMKKKSAAEILNLIKTEKAQAFAERYAGYRVPSSTQKADKETPAQPEPEATKP